MDEKQKEKKEKLFEILKWVAVIFSIAASIKKLFE